jgi:hypothetical protein
MAGQDRRRVSPSRRSRWFLVAVSMLERRATRTAPGPSVPAVPDEALPALSLVPVPSPPDPPSPGRPAAELVEFARAVGAVRHSG